MVPSCPGPRLLNPAIVSAWLVAPVEKLSTYPPGHRMLLGPGPSLPAENSGKIPASIQASTSARNSSTLVQPATKGVHPHELFTTAGRRSGLGFCPCTSVGAIIH